MICLVCVLSGCKYSDNSMATTKITADYSQNNIYFYRYSNEQENEVALIQHNLYTDEEKILLTTDVLVGMLPDSKQSQKLNSLSLSCVVMHVFLQVHEEDTLDGSPRNH